MKTIAYCVFFLFSSLSALAQYPFEKYPAVKYKKIPFILANHKNDSTTSGTAVYGNYKFVVQDRSRDVSPDYNCKLTIYHKGKPIFNTTIEHYILWDDCPLNVCDINGDGLIDFKLTVPNSAGSGLAGSRVWKIYLFNKGNNQFNKVSFGDFYSEEGCEYDLNGDGNYEIVTKHYISYKNHAYWCFDLFNYFKGKLVNVSNHFNYPIMIRFLGDKDEYTVTGKISRLKMKSFSFSRPELYEEGK